MALADDAIALAMPVFACAKDKKPVTKHGFKDATFDHAEIRAQFAHPAAASIGVPTGSASSTICIDIDVKSGARGLEWLEANRHRLPHTRTHQTGSGGFHLLFLTPRGDVQIPNSASRIAPGVDVRGEGGYIIVPPSPGYSITDDAAVAEMPDWLVVACLPPRPEPQERPARQPQPDTGGNIKYGLAALSDECDTVMNAHPGTQEIKLNEAALKIGGLVKGGELDRGFAFSSLVSAGMGMVNAGKPWTHREIEEKVRRGFDDATPRSVPEMPELSRKSRAEASETQKASKVRNSIDGAKQASATVYPLPITWFADAAPNLDAADFVEETLTEGGMSVAYGESNSGKTFFATDIGLHIALGRSWNGREVERGGVLYLALEGRHGIQNRIAAFRAHYGLEDAVIPFAFAAIPVNLLDPDADRDAVIETIKRAADEIQMPVRLTVVDTLSRAMAGGNENAPDDMGALVSNGDAIRSETGTHLSWVHHSGKDALKGARGHSLLRAATDTEIEITNEDGLRRARVTKQRDLECTGDFAFTLKTVDLGLNRRGKPVTSCVVETGDINAMSPGNGRSSIPKGQATIAYRILCDLIAQYGEAGHGCPDGVLSAPEEWWRERFYDQALPGADRKTREKAFRRAADALIERRIAACGKGRVWL